MASIIEYRIHPSVGIARMGDSSTIFFVGPEEVNLNGRFVPTLEIIPAAGTTSDIGPAGGFRDANGKLAKQAAHFRVFAYEYRAGMGGKRQGDYPIKVTEVTSTKYKIEWKVEVANTKSFADWQLFSIKNPNLPGGLTLSSESPAHAQQPQGFAAASRLQLGSAVLRDDGSLLVLGSNGETRALQGSPPPTTKQEGVFWQNWEDDAADGPVQARITPREGGSAKDARSAWVVIGPPRYAPDIWPPVTLYDKALSLGLAHKGRLRSDFVREPTSFELHILPILYAYAGAAWVSERAARAHQHVTYDFDFKSADPDVFLDQLRGPMPDIYGISNFARPEGMGYPKNAYPPLWLGQPMTRLGTGNTAGEYVEAERMPKLMCLALTEVQYKRMRDWQQGAFTKAPVGPLDKTVNLPFVLDFAAMSSMSGGSFCPGIEVGNQAAVAKNWQADYGAVAGHVDLRFGLDANYGPSSAPGALTGTLAVPWHADMVDCDDDWWPHARPNWVTGGLRDPNRAFVRYKWLSTDRGNPSAKELNYQGMVTNWTKLGMVRKQSKDEDGFWEEDRRM